MYMYILSEGKIQRSFMCRSRNVHVYMSHLYVSKLLLRQTPYVIEIVADANPPPPVIAIYRNSCYAEPSTSSIFIVQVCTSRPYNGLLMATWQSRDHDSSMTIV